MFSLQTDQWELTDFLLFIAEWRWFSWWVVPWSSCLRRFLRHYGKLQLKGQSCNLCSSITLTVVGFSFHAGMNLLSDALSKVGYCRGFNGLHFLSALPGSRGTRGAALVQPWEEETEDRRLQAAGDSSSLLPSGRALRASSTVVIPRSSLVPFGFCWTSAGPIPDPGTTSLHSLSCVSHGCMVRCTS